MGTWSKHDQFFEDIPFPDTPKLTSLACGNDVLFASSDSMVEKVDLIQLAAKFNMFVCRCLKGIREYPMSTLFLLSTIPHAQIFFWQQLTISHRHYRLPEGTVVTISWVNYGPGKKKHPHDWFFLFFSTLKWNWPADGSRAYETTQTKTSSFPPSLQDPSLGQTSLHVRGHQRSVERKPAEGKADPLPGPLLSASICSSPRVVFQKWTVSWPEKSLQFVKFTTFIHILNIVIQLSSILLDRIWWIS